MTSIEIYQTLVHFVIAGLLLNLVAAVITIVASLGEYLRCRTQFEYMLDMFYKFYLEGFLPTMILLIFTTVVLKMIGGF